MTHISTTAGVRQSAYQPWDHLFAVGLQPYYRHIKVPYCELSVAAEGTGRWRLSLGNALPKCVFISDDWLVE